MHQQIVQNREIDALDQSLALYKIELPEDKLTSRYSFEQVLMGVESLINVIEEEEEKAPEDNISSDPYEIIGLGYQQLHHT